MFSRTWWGQRFLEALERFTDPARLGRGRSYARGGRILEYHIKNGTVTARVKGSVNPYFGVYTAPTYTTTVALKTIRMPDWTRAIAAISSRAGYVARLLMNEMPDTIDELFAELGLPLLPHDRQDLVTDCSCPDWANPCKHIAGLYYLLASDLDRDPFLLFELRGLSRGNLRKQLAESPLGTILAAELVPREVPIEPAASFYTEPIREPAAITGYREFWQGARRLPDLAPSSVPAVPALLIRRQGDYPDFWPKDASFIATMAELYERVRMKSPGLKS
jgi:uncharacterized Zn finger protein